MKLFSHPHAPLVAFVVIALAGGVGLQHQQNTSAHQQQRTSNALYQSALRSCNRGNVTRQKLNAQTENQRDANRVTIQFLHVASKAWRANFARTGFSADKQTAQQYSLLAGELITDNAHLPSYPAVNCKLVVNR